MQKLSSFNSDVAGRPVKNDRRSARSDLLDCLHLFGQFCCPKLPTFLSLEQNSLKKGFVSQCSFNLNDSICSTLTLVSAPPTASKFLVANTPSPNLPIDVHEDMTACTYMVPEVPRE